MKLSKESILLFVQKDNNALFACDFLVRDIRKMKFELSLQVKVKQKIVGKRKEKGLKF